MCIVQSSESCLFDPRVGWVPPIEIQLGSRRRLGFVLFI